MRFKFLDMTEREFKKLYNLYFRPLCLYALHYVSDAAASEDIVQDSFGRMILTEGMSASYYPETGLQEMTSGDVLNPMAWATGCFVYDDSALDEVIKDLEFFYHVKINVSGSVDGKKLTGTFPTADLSSVLELISMACGVELTKFP